MSNLDRFCAILAETYEYLFATDPDYQHVHSAGSTPEWLARKMTLSLSAGTASKDGKDIRRTCKELGIPYTYKAIRAYLEADVPRINTLSVFTVGRIEDVKRVFRKVSIGTIGGDARIAHQECVDGQWVDSENPCETTV